MLRTPSPRKQDFWKNQPSAAGWDKLFLRIGHSGAAAHAPANTLRSLALALEIGVDMVEFDVRPCRDALVLLHNDELTQFSGSHRLASGTSLVDLRSLVPDPDSQIPTLVEALDLLKGRTLLNIDLKAPGYEREVVELVRDKGMSGDVLYSSLYAASLAVLRQLDPGAKMGLSYPEDRGNASGKPYMKPIVDTALAVMRFGLPYRILGMMAGARANAVMLYHKVISARVVRTVQNAGGRVYAWTVDTPERIRELQALRVNGIASNRPELFSMDDHALRSIP